MVLGLGESSKILLVASEVSPVIPFNPLECPSKRALPVPSSKREEGGADEAADLRRFVPWKLGAPLKANPGGGVVTDECG